VEVFINSSGSFHEVGKLESKLGMIKEASKSSKAIYLYSNLSGSDGSFFQFDGVSIVAQNGKICKMGE